MQFKDYIKTENLNEGLEKNVVNAANVLINYLEAAGKNSKKFKFTKDIQGVLDDASYAIEDFIGKSNFMHNS